MKKPVFVNTNKEAITETLIKIGKHRLQEAIKMQDAEIPRQTERFKIKWNGGRGVLTYNYTSSNNLRNWDHIMILHNNELPDFGWSIEWRSY